MTMIRDLTFREWIEWYGPGWKDYCKQCDENPSAGKYYKEEYEWYYRNEYDGYKQPIP